MLNELKCLTKIRKVTISLLNLRNLKIVLPEAALELILGKGVLQICSKYTGEHQCRSVIPTLLKSHFSMGVLLQICSIFSQHLLLRTPMEGYFCNAFICLKVNM